MLKTNKTILHLAQLGYVVMVGRASNIVAAKMPGGVHIRLISAFEKRVARVQEYYKMTPQKAREFVLTEDRHRKDYVRKYFNEDIENPLLYDMTINVDTLDRPGTIQVIGDLVLKRFPRQYKS